jgi:hypothetical protein
MALPFLCQQAAVADPFLRRRVLALAAASRGYLLARTHTYPSAGVGGSGSGEQVVLSRGEGGDAEVYRRVTRRTGLGGVAWAGLKGEDRALEKVRVNHLELC